jgi:hypothetical protein
MNITIDRSNLIEADFTMLALDTPKTEDKILSITPTPMNIMQTAIMGLHFEEDEFGDDE